MSKIKKYVQHCAARYDCNNAFILLLYYSLSVSLNPPGNDIGSVHWP